MNLRKEKGAISIFVLVALLFMTAFLIISFAGNINKAKTAKEQFNIVSDIYAYGGGDTGAYDKAYTDLREKNKQILSYNSESLGLTSVSRVDLEKTFESNLKSLKIYGNSVQDGTPSPLAPVEIQSVGEKTKNLINYKNFKSRASDYPLIINDNGSLQYNGNYYISIDISFLESGKTYTFDCDYECNESLTPTWRIMYNDSTFSKMETVGRNIETDETKVIEKLYLYGASNSTIYDIVFYNIQLKESAVSTEYEPYDKYKIPISISGKNLCTDKYLVYNNYNSFVLDKGTITTTGSAYLGFLAKVQPNTTYTVSYFQDTEQFTGSSAQRVQEYSDYPSAWEENRLGMTVNRWVTTTGLVKTTFTTGSTTQYINFGFYCDAAGLKVNNIQVELGDKATEYTVNSSKIYNIYLNEPLKKAGDVADYIDFSTGEVIRNVKISKISNLNFLKYPDSNGYHRFETSSISDKLFTEQLTKNILSTVLIPTTYNESANNSIAERQNYNYLRILTNEYETLEELLAAIGDKEIYYASNESEKTEIIKLPEIPTTEDYTVIEILTEVAPSKIEMEYEGYTMD